MRLLLESYESGHLQHTYTTYLQPYKTADGLMLSFEHEHEYSMCSDISWMAWQDQYEIVAPGSCPQQLDPSLQEIMGKGPCTAEDAIMVVQVIPGRCLTSCILPTKAMRHGLE